MPRTQFRTLSAILMAASLVAIAPRAFAADPDPKTYWDVRDLRPGMKGVGRTVMVGTELVEFQAEVLGVLRGVNPGRDMILCRLSGCNLEHAGIIQGMSGSPIYIDGKLVGAVAYAWEFAKDPIAGVTPFSQMVQYVQTNERRIAAGTEGNTKKTVSLDPEFWNRDADSRPAAAFAFNDQPREAAAGGLAGMTPIATPLAATGFSPRALAMLDDRLRPLGMAPVAGGGVLDDVLERCANAKLEPGSPVSVAMVTGDFDLSGIGTVTHVEGDRVYAFGHPMMSLGACEFPMMTGYIHTVYPRASVSMKMGSPLRVVGVMDTDVSTAISGRIGAKPDMLPMTISVDGGRFSERRNYSVEMVREPNLLSALVMTVLTSAVDTEGDQPDELTARVTATIEIKGHDPVVIRETHSGARISGSTGPGAIFASIGNTVSLIARNPLAALRIESIQCEVALEPRRTLAEITAVSLVSDRLEAGDTLQATVTLKPFKGGTERILLNLPLPTEIPPGTYEASFCDLTRTLQRQFRNQPGMLEPKTPEQLLALVRARAKPSRSAVSIHVALPSRGVSIAGQALPDLPASARSVIASTRQTADPTVREDLSATVETPWVVEGGQNLTFQVVRDRGTAALNVNAGQ